MVRRKAAAARVSGPMAGYAAGFNAELCARGYTELSSWRHVRLLACLSDWLRHEGLGPVDLTSERVARFLDMRRRVAPSGLRTERGLAPLLDHLRRLGAAPMPVTREPDGPVERVLVRYRDFLERERGLRPATVARCLATARPFLERRVAAGPLSALDGADVTGFVLRECRSRGTGSAKLLVSELRVLLRFLHLEGEAPALADAVPPVAGWRGGSLPRALDRDELARLLASPDRATAMGRRDHALLTLLARLGLRAGEVAARTRLPGRALGPAVPGRGTPGRCRCHRPRPPPPRPSRSVVVVPSRSCRPSKSRERGGADFGASTKGDAHIRGSSASGLARDRPPTRLRRGWLQRDHPCDDS
jgi:integrase/recombinase XerD